MSDAITTARAELVTRRDFTIAAIHALDMLAGCYVRERAGLAEPRATKPTRKAVIHTPMAKKPAQGNLSAPARPVPMGGVRGRVLLALRSRVSATTREIAHDRGCTVAAASSALQALRDAGFCTLNRKVWTAVKPVAASSSAEFDVAWNGTKERNGEAPGLSRVTHKAT